MVENEWTKFKQKEITEKKKNEWTARLQRAKSRSNWDKEYSAYLRSDIWRGIRAQALQKANNKCERCGAINVKLDVHHRTYQNAGGFEKPDELQVLCYRCHNKADRRREEETSIRIRMESFQARFHAYLDSRNIDTLDLDFDEKKAKQKFLLLLYKKRCLELGEIISNDFDPEYDADFLDFKYEISAEC